MTWLLLQLGVFELEGKRRRGRIFVMLMAFRFIKTLLEGLQLNTPREASLHRLGPSKGVGYTCTTGGGLALLLNIVVYCCVSKSTNLLERVRVGGD